MKNKKEELKELIFQFMEETHQERIEDHPQYQNKSYIRSPKFIDFINWVTKLD